MNHSEETGFEKKDTHPRNRDVEERDSNRVINRADLHLNLLEW